VKISFSITLAFGLVACARSGTGGVGATTAFQDLDDISGAELTDEGRLADRAEDQSQMGVRVRDDGSIVVGGTEDGEVMLEGKPEGLYNQLFSGERPREESRQSEERVEQVIEENEARSPDDGLTPGERLDLEIESQIEAPRE
jgi:hypothetical protein